MKKKKAAALIFITIFFIFSPYCSTNVNSQSTDSCSININFNDVVPFDTTTLTLNCKPVWQPQGYILRASHAEKHVAIEGELIVQPSDDHFWFNQPQIVLFLIHFIIFQNAFEIAYFFWIWVQYGFDSCIMGKVAYIVPRLIIGVIIQVLCSYSTLPLYAIVTQMGSNFKKVKFDEHVQAGLLGWAQKAKKKKGLKPMSNDSGQSGSNDGSTGTARIEVARRAHKEPATEDIQPTP